MIANVEKAPEFSARNLEYETIFYDDDRSSLVHCTSVRVLNFYCLF